MFLGFKAATQLKCARRQCIHISTETLLGKLFQLIPKFDTICIRLADRPTDWLVITHGLMSTEDGLIFTSYHQSLFYGQLAHLLLSKPHMLCTCLNTQTHTHTRGSLIKAIAHIAMMHVHPIHSEYYITGCVYFEGLFQMGCFYSKVQTASDLRW